MKSDKSEYQKSIFLKWGSVSGIFSQINTLHSIETTKGTKLAIVIHLYYPEMWPLFEHNLKNINVPFDLYLSVKQENKDLTINKINDCHGATNILAYPNRGRDVLPFLYIARIIKKKRTYEYLLKLHTKKSPHRKDGDEWLNSLLNELVPKDTSKIIDTLEKQDTGVIGPITHVVSLSRYLGDNRQNIEAIITKYVGKKAATEIVDRASLYPFFAGTMFWARLDFFYPILSNPINAESFEKENGQVDGTLAHALERVFGKILHSITKKKMYTVNNDGVYQLTDRLYDDEYRYVG